MSEEDFKDYEFILVTEEIQKKLNQWRHIYRLRIIAMTANEGILTLLIARKSNSGGN